MSTALAELDDADGLRFAARGVRQQVLAQLPDLLERFSDAVMDRGGHVCWASTASDARHYVASLVVRHNARRVVKSKSMVTEEIGLTAAIEACRARVVETDLGEWIMQLADEVPSHLVAPALHQGRQQIHELFVQRAEAQRRLGREPDELVQFARRRLRDEFLTADIGITGANLAIADTGSVVLVTNEGNARLVTALPRIHVVVLGMERLAADWEQAELLLALLARSTTGQRLSSYTTVLTGPRHPDEADGPEELHVVIVDNGRSQLLGGERQEMSSCSRCGAGVSVCPGQSQSGGHTHGWMYPGPIASVLTPLMAGTEGLHTAAELADASTLCGACMDACPVDVPLQDMLQSLRRHKEPHASRAERTAWRLWAAAWSDPRRYGLTTRAASWGRWATRLAGHLPVGSGWGAGRDLPQPAAERFRDRWWKGLV